MSSHFTPLNAVSVSFACIQNQSLSVDSLHPRTRLNARWQQSIFIGWQAHTTLYGLLNFSNYTVLPEIAVAKIREDALSIKPVTSAVA